MKITIRVDEPTGDFQDRLLDLLAEHAAQVEIDSSWTVERAERYYRELPPRAQRIVREAVARDGKVAAADLRDDSDSSLRGHSGSLKRVLQRGQTQGWLPHGIPAPIVAEGPGFGKVRGYTMPKQFRPVFTEALADH